MGTPGKAVVVRRKRKSGGTGWSRRLAGVALVAFFALGYFAGLGSATHLFTRRALDAVTRYSSRLREESTRLRQESELIRRLPMGRSEPPPAPAHTGGPVAIVERRDGFYALYEWGELRRPVPVGAQDSLPIISGAPLEGARPADLVGYAGIVVRAEGNLGEMVSELRLGDDGEASLFLDRSRTEVALDLDHAPIELERAGRVLRRWRGHEAEIASLDMTTPNQAVMRLRSSAFASAKNGRARKIGKPGIARAPSASLAAAALPAGAGAVGRAPMGVVEEVGLR